MSIVVRAILSMALLLVPIAALFEEMFRGGAMESSIALAFLLWIAFSVVAGWMVGVMHRRRGGAFLYLVCSILIIVVIGGIGVIAGVFLGVTDSSHGGSLLLSRISSLGTALLFSIVLSLKNRNAPSDLRAG